nr:SseB family protein [Streptomyces sp. SID3343]
MIPVFTSPEELVRWTRRETPWFAMTGAELVAQFPDGYDLALNLAGEHPVRLHARLWRGESIAETDHGGIDG